MEYFYLTNEENLTYEEISESVLSSRYMPQIDFVQIYHKELTEEELERYGVVGR